jgi:peroxiredoxin
MPIAVGDRLPNVTLRQLTPEGITEVTTAELFANKKAILFAVPGAFTPTCSDRHLPGFVTNADALRAKGYDLIACVAVNDPFVMGAWSKVSQVGDKVVMLSDGNAELVKALGLELDASGFGLGLRSKRYVMVLDDGKVTDLRVEANPGAVEVSGAEALLAGA